MCPAPPCGQGRVHAATLLGADNRRHPEGGQKQNEVGDNVLHRMIFIVPRKRWRLCNKMIMEEQRVPYARGK